MKLRTAVAIATSLLTLPFMFSAPVNSQDGKGKKANAAPASSNFTITLNGFRVNNESDDDILEGDGKRDEVYLRADVWVLNRDGNVPYKRAVKSAVMGDVNRQDRSRIQAGNASYAGGLRSSDKFPTEEPWRRTTNPLPDRPPMLLWQGSLAEGENVVVIIPTVWEWDSYDLSASEIRWDGERDHWFSEVKPRLLNLITGRSELALFHPGIGNRTRRSDLGDSLNDAIAAWGGFYLGNIAGTRPIGGYVLGTYLGNNDRRFLIEPHFLTFTYSSAQQAARTSPGDVAPGVFALNYRDLQDKGDYTLYLQVEQNR